MVKFSAHIYVEKLRLNQLQDVHVIPCPFHPDSMPSLSINLSKAVHYCHGGCGEPRGGGPLQFLFKWAKYVDKKPISMSEARSQLRSARKLPDRKTLRREVMMKEVSLFLAYAAPRFANRCKELERAIADVTRYCAKNPKQVDDEVWTLLATCHRELQWCDDAFVALNPRKITSDVLHIFAECKRRGWWNVGDLDFEWAITDAHSRERMITRQLEEQCLANPSRRSIPRTPIPRRTPIPIP